MILSLAVGWTLGTLCAFAVLRETYVVPLLMIALIVVWVAYLVNIA